jgi:hypothetical protein
MRRRRIEAIEAENEEEFLEILAKKDEINDNLSSRRKRNKKKFLEINEDENDDEYDLLKSNSNYVLEKKSLSIEEQEKIDENELNNVIKELNLEKFNSDFSNSINSISTIESFSSPEKVLKFYEQNIINYDEKLKIIIIGKAKSGKSFFIKQFSKDDNNNNFNFNIYNPTISLEFKNTLININNLNIKIEFIDTNDNIISSNIIQTYYKISNGFIIITKDLKKDFDYINDKISLIKSCVNNPNIAIIVNNNFNNSKDEVNYFPDYKQININLLNVNKYNIELIDFINSLRNNNYIRKNRNCKTVQCKFNVNVNNNNNSQNFNLFKNLI